MGYTLESIKVESLSKGSKFFSPEFKAAFKTRYSKRVAEGPGGVFFVTSEEIPTASGIPERRFAVRSYNPLSGDVSDVSALGQYATDYSAHVYAKAIANPEPIADAKAPEFVPEPLVKLTLVPPLPEEPAAEAAPQVSAATVVAALVMCVPPGEEPCTALALVPAAV